MSASKREREAARRQNAQRTAGMAPRERARRRQRTVGLIVVAALVLTLGVSATLLFIQMDRSDGQNTAQTPPPAAPEPVEPQNSALVPAPEIAENRPGTGAFETNRGEIAFELDGAAAPQAVANFVTLAEDGFFDSTKCHRLVTSGIYILQCGDPDASGMVGPGYDWGPIENAPSDDVYPAGTIAMARVGNNAFSMGSQFFLVYEDSPIPSDSAGGYTVFGHITSGLDVLTTIADEGNGADGVAPMSDVIIEGVQVQ